MLRANGDSMNMDLIDIINMANTVGCSDLV